MIYYGGECAGCYGPADMDNSDLYIEVRYYHKVSATLRHKSARTCDEYIAANNRSDSGASGSADGPGVAAPLDEHTEDGKQA